MSLLPLIFSNWWENLEQPHRLVDQDFGLGMSPESLMTPKAIQVYANLLPRESGSRCPMAAAYYRPWGKLMRNGETGASTVKADKDKFQVVLDVQQFAPEEINVKVVDQFVVVEGKHEEKQDEHGWVSRQFSRRYMIPEQCDIDLVASKLSSDGVLTISVPRKEKPAPNGERVISIEHTGKPAVRDSQEGKKKSDKEETVEM